MKYLFVILAAGAVFAANCAVAETGSKAMCLKAAAATKAACAATCAATYRDDRYSCGANPDCHKACKTGYDACVEPNQKALDACFDGCQPSYEQAVTACKIQVVCQGDCWQRAEFLSCIRPAGVARYNCRRDCVDAQRLDPAVKSTQRACSQARNVCHKQCAKKATPAPAPAP